MDPQLYRAAAYDDGARFGRFAMDADTNVLLKETPQRNTILHVAALNKQAQIAEKILHLHPSLLYHKNSDGDTALHIAATVGCPEIVQLLLNYEKSGSEEIEANQKATRMVNLANDTVLHGAARNGHVDVVELLMEEDPGLALLVNAAGESPLFVAVERQFFDIVQHFLQLKDECCYGGRDGMNALHAAVLCLPRDIMEEVMRKCPSAVTEEDDLGYTPLHYAALFGRVEVIELFFTDDNSIAYRKSKAGMSAFHIAAKNGFVGVMRKLITNYPDIWELLNGNGQTALHLAVEGGKSFAVKYLLTILGSDGFWNRQDKDGNTALHLAAITEDYKILMILLKDKRVDGRLVNKEGLTAFDIIQSSEELKNYQKRYISSELIKIGGLPNLKQVLLHALQNTETVGKEKLMKEAEEKTYGEVPRPERNRVKHIYPIRREKQLKERRYTPRPVFPPNLIKEASETDILIATIIATVTFAAAFQVPGGYESEDPFKGLPVYRNKKLFNSFIICDSLAFGLSSASIFIHFLASMGKGTPGATHILQYAIVSTYYSILAMVGAFVSALCLVSTNSKGLKVAAYVCGASFFAGFLFAIFEKCLNVAIHKLKDMERNAYEQQ